MSSVRDAATNEYLESPLREFDLGSTARDSMPVKYYTRDTSAAFRSSESRLQARLNKPVKSRVSLYPLTKFQRQSALRFSSFQLFLSIQSHTRALQTIILSSNSRME